MSPKLDNNGRKPAARPSVAKQMRHAKPSVNTSSPAESALVTRRRFLYGAVGVGAVAAVGIGAAAYTSSVNAANSTITSLTVPKHALLTLNDFTPIDSADGVVQQTGEIDLPYGTLVWANDESVAACLLPTESGSPLTQVGLVNLVSSSSNTVIEKAVGASEGFEIYDVRANGKGIIWTEANILQGTWRIYASTVNGEAIGSPRLLDEGDSAYQTPTITVAGNRAIWLANPKEADDPSAEIPAARLMSAPFGSGDGVTLLESSRPMGTPPYAYNDTVTVAPRIDSSSVYYQLTNLDTTSGDVRDTITLPHAIAPTEAGYGDTGFMFSFPDIYDYDSAIANLGTYMPIELPVNGDYDNATWFDFARTPTAPPAWCNGRLIVKSTYAVCVVNLDANSYYTIDVENGADTYGEYLASTGSNDSFVTYTNIDHAPVGSARIHACRVKTWTTLT